jgi:hypothetical protein
MTAFEKTKKILLEPFNIWVWAKLVLIAFFAGALGGGSNVGNNFSGSSEDLSNLMYSTSNAFPNSTLLLLAILFVIFIVVLVIVMLYLRSVFTFVFINALTTRDVKIVKPFRENMDKGLKLFLFNILLILVSLIIALIIIGPAIYLIFKVINIGSMDLMSSLSFIVIIFAIILLVILFICFVVLMSIITGFTYDFVAPFMYFKGMGIVEGWKHLISKMEKEPLEFLIYIFARWILQLIIGLASLIILLPLIFILVIGLIAAAFIGALLAEVSIWLLLPVILVAGIFMLACIILIMFVTMPIAVYFRYYSLDFLKEMDDTAVMYT